MFGPVGITEVAAITQLAEEAGEAAAFPFDILFNILGVEVPGEALLSSADLEEYMDPDQFLQFLGELDWPRTQAARVEFTRTILSSILVGQKNGDSDSVILRSSSAPVVPTSCAVLASIIVSSGTDEEGWETIFWFLDREGVGVVSIASVWALLPAMASVAVAAVHTAYLGEKSNSDAEAYSKERCIKVFRLLEKALTQALDCLGSLQPGDLVSAEAFTALADKVAEELMLIISHDEDSSEDSDMESSRGSELPLSSSNRSFYSRRTSIFNRATTIGSSISFKPWRKGKPGRASDTGVVDAQTTSGLTGTIGSPEAAALRGTTPRTPRTPSNNLVSNSASMGQLPQQKEITLRPSLVAAQKAAEQAAEAAAAELRPQRKAEQGVLKPAKEAISEQLLGLGVMLGTRLCVADAARMLMTSALLMTNAAVIAALIIHANIPITAAIGYTVIIDIILAGIMFFLAFKGLSCCFSCCQPKRERLDAMPSVFEEQVRPAVQKYVQNIQRMITNNEAPHNLRDVDEESALEGHESGDVMMQGFSGDLSRSHGVAGDTGSPRSNAEPHVPVLQRAQSLWQVIGRVAGFEPQHGGFQSGAATSARMAGHHGVEPVSAPGSPRRPSSVVDPLARAQRSSQDESSSALSWAASPDGSLRRLSIASGESPRAMSPQCSPLMQRNFRTPD